MKYKLDIYELTGKHLYTGNRIDSYGKHKEILYYSITHEPYVCGLKTARHWKLFYYSHPDIYRDVKSTYVKITRND